ncbi:MAG: cell division protein CrgA [Brachybacterium sp.]|nr:cell division protein CrgA [Brachybacterium sp.]
MASKKRRAGSAPEGEDPQGFDGFDGTIDEVEDAGGPGEAGTGRVADPTPKRDRRSRTRPVDPEQVDPARPKRSARDEAEQSTRRRTPSAASTQNPPWLAPTAVTLLILGLVYLVAYYLSGATLPLPIGDWNLLVGFALMILGGTLLMRWK